MSLISVKKVVKDYVSASYECGVVNCFVSFWDQVGYRCVIVLCHFWVVFSLMNVLL